MKFNDQASDKQGIVSDIFFILFGNSDDHTADYPLADIARNVNRYYDKAVIKILQADSQWEWDDNNKADLPISNINLVSGQQSYGISGASYLKIGKLDVKDASGNSIRLRQFQEDELADIADNTFKPTAGTPRFYRLQANSVFLYPTPNYSYTNGLRIFYQRNVDYFASTDTDKVPGFAETFHRILSLGAAHDYAQTAGMSGKINNINTELATMFQDLEVFYSTRNDNKVSMKTHRTDYGEMSLGQIGYNGYSNNPNGF